jgi:HPr kinase/phosphorylase
VLVGADAILIRGPSGAGKSRLAFDLIAAPRGLLFARLVADDRVSLEAHCGRLIARPPAGLAGLLEVRGLGIRRLPFEEVAAVGRVIDLADPDGARMPESNQVVIEGIALPRLAVAPGQDPFRLVLATLTSGAGST